MYIYVTFSRRTFEQSIFINLSILGVLYESSKLYSSNGIVKDYPVEASKRCAILQIMLSHFNSYNYHKIQNHSTILLEFKWNSQRPVHWSTVHRKFVNYSKYIYRYIYITLMNNSNLFIRRIIIDAKFKDSMFRQLTASFNVFPSADVTMFSIFVEYQRMRKLKKLIVTK